MFSNRSKKIQSSIIQRIFDSYMPLTDFYEAKKISTHMNSFGAKSFSEHQAQVCTFVVKNFHFIL
jgi:hypothetical protein